MTRPSRIGFAQLPHALLLDPGLTRLDRDLAHALLLIAKRDPAVEVPNRRLAELCRCSVRAVQSALGRLASAGWIGLARDVAGRLQRRINLYFRPESKPMPHACTGGRPSGGATYAPGDAPGPPPPKNPPRKPEIQDDDDDLSELLDGLDVEHEYAPPVEETCPDVGSSSSFLPPLEDLIGREPDALPHADPAPEAERKATAGEVSEAYAKAAAIWGDSRETRAKVRELAVQFGSLHWVSRALDIAADRAKRESIGMGFLVGVLRNFAREGGPPPPPSAPPRKPEAPPAWQRPVAEEPTPEEVEEMRARAASDRGPAGRLARAVLAALAGKGGAA